MPNVGVIKDPFPRVDKGAGRGRLKDAEGGMEMRNILAQIAIKEIEDDNITSVASKEEKKREEKKEQEGGTVDTGVQSNFRSMKAEKDPKDDSKNDTVKEEKVNPTRYKYEGSLQVEADFKIPYNLGNTKYGKYESKGRFLVLSYRSRPYSSDNDKG